MSSIEQILDSKPEHDWPLEAKIEFYIQQNQLLDELTSK